MTFQFNQAKRENVNLLIALAGPSGSGKTYSALRMAQGLANGRPIAFIDSENRRGLHYADKFDFLHADMQPQFRPNKFIEGVKAAEAAGAGVVIIDSFSHEYDGEGGIVDWASELEGRGMKSPLNWKEPKMAHKRLMNELLQCKASIIFCLRADEKIEVVREGGKTQIRPLGWVPICEKRFMYEMTASFTLTADRPGKPNFTLPHKLQDQHRPFFPENEFIDENAGIALAKWASGGVTPPVNVSAPEKNRTELMDIGDGAAFLGMDALQQFWSQLSPADKKLVGGAEQLGTWKIIAEKADNDAAISDG